jgi:hypothetical protein
MMAFQIPDSAYPRCLVCGAPVHPNSRMLWEITGFERDRADGGTNHVIARQRTGRVVGDCHAEQVRSGTVGQETLL